MDANSLIGNNKQQKYHDGEGKNESGVNFGDLPDALLQQIISNLPTKEAVRTSVLSKRWVNQWMDISRLELEEESLEKRDQFINFVGKLLHVYNALCLKSFSLVFDVGEDAPRVNQWLYGLIKPNLEELYLDFDNVHEPLHFPDDLFTSQSLKKLELGMPQVFNLPSLIQIQSLKAMTLKHVIFPGNSLTQRLFASCPSLEELTLIDCNWKNVRHICIACPSLKKLIIREWKDDEDDDRLDEENDGVLNAPSHCQIAIIGGNMKTFVYDGDLINDYLLYWMVSVTDATVEVHPSESTLDPSYFVFKLFKALSDVEKLTFSDFAVEALCQMPLLTTHLPVFQNLVELRVISVSPIDVSCGALQAMLRKSPLLKSVEFVMGVSLPQNAANNVGPLPACFADHLKSIQISGFSGTEEELHAIKFLLQSAPVLDEFLIYTNLYVFNSDEDLDRLNMLHEHILGFPRASVNCYIDLA